MKYGLRPGLSPWQGLVEIINAVWVLTQIVLGCGIVYAALYLLDLGLN